MSWKISKKEGHCEICEKNLQDKEEHYSSLSFEGEKISRRDFCIECWEKNAKNGSEFFWRTRHELGAQKKRKIDYDGLRDLFVQLCENRSPEKESLHYIVGLLLIRKRLLKIHGVEKLGQGESLQVGFSRSPERYSLPVPNLDPQHLDALKAELVDLLGEPSEENPNPLPNQAVADVSPGK